MLCGDQILPEKLFCFGLTLRKGIESAGCCMGLTNMWHWCLLPSKTYQLLGLMYDQTFHVFGVTVMFARTWAGICNKTK